jgi:hypothetical protein
LCDEGQNVTPLHVVRHRRRWPRDCPPPNRSIHHLIRQGRFDRSDDMRKIVSVGLIVVVMMAALSSPLVAQSGGTLTGVARGNHLQSVSGATVQVRNLNTGAVVSSTVTTEGGAFTFSALPTGNYIVEVISAAGKVLGTGAPVSVTAGDAATTSVIALGFTSSSAATTTASGFSFLGMGPVTTLSVLGAAAAASVTAVVSTRPDASPSR